MTVMAFRQSRTTISKSMPLLVRFYTSSNLPAKSTAPGTMGNPTPSSSVDKIHPPIGSQYKSQGTSISRTIRNIWKAGFKRAFWQIKEMNDTKAGTLIGTDRFNSGGALANNRLGNRYYEDMGELPLRERWVEYAEPHEYDSTQIEPGWHAWMTYMTNEPPTIDPSLRVGSTNPKWERPWHGTTTQTAGAYQPYSTVKLKYKSANDTLKPTARQ